MCGCTVVCELWYLNVCVRGLQAVKAHIFLNFIFVVIREKDQLYLSLESIPSIKKTYKLAKGSLSSQSAVCYIITHLVFHS